MARKYEYKYVKVKTAGLNADDYKDIIDKHVNDGWRLVTTIDKTRYGTLAIPTIELVFEKEVKS